MNCLDPCADHGLSFNVSPASQGSVSPHLEDAALDLAEKRHNLEIRRVVQQAREEQQCQMIETYTHRLALQHDEEFRAKAEINRLKETLNEQQVCRR